ncbi:MAG: Co2+/Mg2+ efflux protein ApaG [Methyloligellaceae bacterium]
MYESITDGFRVRVEPDFMHDRSSPQKGQFFWAYTVEITNLGLRTGTLRSRYWRIIDGQGKVEEVSGPGVVGEEPELSPGEQFVYTSGCPLTTPSGFMEGYYILEMTDGDDLKVAIPAFSLDSPHASTSLN